MMNFWPPTFHPWNQGFTDVGMPFYDKYDWIRVWDYDAVTDGFRFRWHDDLDYINYSRWAVSENGGFESNKATFKQS